MSCDEEASVRSKARFVNSVVDIVIGPVICPFNLCSQSLRKEINALVLIGNYVIELRVEHAYDFTGLHVDMVSSSILLSRRVEDTPHC